MAFVRAAAVDDLWGGEMLGACVRGKHVLLVYAGGDLRAYDDRCPHQGALLSAGRLDGDRVTCSAHEWTFDAKTGCGINPGTASLRRYPARIEGDDLLVDLVDLVESEEADATDRDGTRLQRDIVQAAASEAAR